MCDIRKNVSLHSDLRGHLKIALKGLKTDIAVGIAYRKPARYSNAL